MNPRRQKRRFPLRFVLFLALCWFVYQAATESKKITPRSIATGAITVISDGYRFVSHRIEDWSKEFPAPSAAPPPRSHDTPGKAEEIKKTIKYIAHSIRQYAQPAQQYGGVRVGFYTNGNSFVYYAELIDIEEATIEFDTKLENMATSRSLPVTIDAMGHKQFDLVTVWPADPQRAWNCGTFTYFWRRGRREQKVDKSYVYSLPYGTGEYRIVQGALGRVTHLQGTESENAIDFGLPEGTEIRAARSGTVIEIKEDSDIGGPDPKYEQCGNHIFVLHPDGSIADYAHLKKNGVLVNLGDTIQKNDLLGLSGNTGYSWGPHLHFAVFANVDARTYKSIPVQFRTKSGTVETLQEGAWY